MSPLNYQALDAIADSFNPLLTLLALAAPFFRKPRAARSAISYCFAAATGLAVVYGVRALDGSELLWQRAGLEYSTHSAYAASLVTSIGCFWRRALGALGIALAAYFTLELILRYHGILDIASSASIAVVAALGAHFVARRAYTRRPAETSPRSGPVG